ncbi:MAG: YceI family protein [Rhodothermales bacterium]|nr:YceI family protein [Rhodothermales bacterium]
MPLLLVLLGLIPNINHADYDTFSVDSSQSVFAVVTHKGGIGAAFAHNHLISASSFQADLRMSEDNPALITFELDVAVDSLRVDHEPDVRRWEDRIAALGIEDKLDTPGDRDRRRIRRTMLGNGQIDASSYPKISVRSGSIQEAELDWCSGQSHSADVDVTIKGTTQTIVFDVCVGAEAGSRTIEAVGSSTFSTFGIKPYSGVLGTVKNKDEIDFYSFIVAHPAAHADSLAG